MTTTAIADLASAYGTYHSGDTIPDDALPGPVREIWAAAGLIETADAPAPEPKHPSIETADAPAPEQAVTRRARARR